MADLYTALQAMMRDLLKPSSQGGLGQSGIELIRTVAGQAANPDRPWETDDSTESRETLRASAQVVGSDMADGETVLFGDIIVRAAYPIGVDWRMPEDEDGASLSISFDGRPPVAVVGSYAVPPSGPPVSITFVVRGSP